jgi:WhiB family transcriptional regulator, redox-sensing transcriptional regulator
MSIVPAEVIEGHWTGLAACAGHPDRRIWFPDFPVETARAIAVCQACPVKEPCLAYALSIGEFDGVWGGTTPRERRRMVRARKLSVVGGSARTLVNG